MAPSLTLGLVDWRGLFEVVLVGTTLLFTATALAWVVITYVAGAGYESPQTGPRTRGLPGPHPDCRRRDVVQSTVDSLPAGFADVHVIAEAAIEVDGATVQVVPDEFEADAIRKGCAIEWARHPPPLLP